MFPQLQLLTKQEVEEGGGGIIQMPACETLFNNLDLSQSDEDDEELGRTTTTHGGNSEEDMEQDWLEEDSMSMN